jgi:hypothetical protein
MNKELRTNSKITKVLGAILALVNVIFAVAWLFRVDLLFPALSEQLGSEALALTALIVSVAGAIFSIPFLVGLNIKSKILRFVSGILAIVPAWVWSMVAIWTFSEIGEVPFTGTALQFTTYAPFSVTWAVLLFDIVWLLAGVYIIRRLGIERVYGSDKSDKNKAKKR